MSIESGSNFLVKSGIPLDAKIITSTITSRNNMPVIERYVGMVVFVVSEQKYYALIGGIANGNWAELAMVAQTPSFDSDTDELQLSGTSAVADLSPLRVVKEDTFQIYKKIGNTDVSIIENGDVRCGFLDAGTFVWQQYNGTSWVDINSITLL